MRELIHNLLLHRPMMVMMEISMPMEMMNMRKLDSNGTEIRPYSNGLAKTTLFAL
jgi:hypothetical protein